MYSKRIVFRRDEKDDESVIIRSSLDETKSCYDVLTP